MLCYEQYKYIFYHTSIEDKILIKSRQIQLTINIRKRAKMYWILMIVSCIDNFYTTVFQKNDSISLFRSPIILKSIGHFIFDPSSILPDTTLPINFVIFFLRKQCSLHTHTHKHVIIVKPIDSSFCSESNNYNSVEFSLVVDFIRFVQVKEQLLKIKIPNGDRNIYWF